MPAAEATVPTVQPSRVLDPQRDAQILDAMPWGHRTAPSRALGFTFVVRTTRASFGRYVEGLFDAMEASDDPPEVYSFLDHGQGNGPCYEVYRGGERISATCDGSAALRRLLWDVNRNAVASASGHLVFHASAAEHQGRALLLPAPKGSGKTTLVAGLVLAGMRYLTDEAVALDPASLLVQPYPKPLAIRRGSWGALSSLEPDPAPELRSPGLSTWYVTPGAIRGDATAPASEPGFIIAHRYVPGARTELVPISRAEGLIALAENSFNITGFGTRRSMDVLATTVRRCRCYRLTVGDLRAATRIVLELADSPEGIG